MDVFIIILLLRCHTQPISLVKHPLAYRAWLRYLNSLDNFLNLQIHLAWLSTILIMLLFWLGWWLESYVAGHLYGRVSAVLCDLLAVSQFWWLGHLEMGVLLYYGCRSQGWLLFTRIINMVLECPVPAVRMFYIFMLDNICPVFFFLSFSSIIHLCMLYLFLWFVYLVNKNFLKKDMWTLLPKLLVWLSN